MNRKAIVIKFVVCLISFLAVLTLIYPENTDAKLLNVKKSQQNRNTINGVIFDPSGRPASDLYVELLNELYSTLGRKKTDGSGRFVFTGLSAGTFKVKVLALGTNYLPVEQEVQLININRGGGGAPVNEYLEIRLRFDKRKINVEAGKAATVFAQEVPEEARKFYEKGVKELDKQKESAFADLKKAIEIFPPYFLALERLGIEYVKRGQYEAAVPFLIRAIEVNNRSSSTYFALGLACYHLKHIKESLEAFRAVTVLNPQFAKGHLWYGIVLHRDGSLESAEKSLLRAKELTKKAPLPEVHWQLAVLYNRTKRNEKAIQELETFLKLQPDNGEKEEIKNLIAKLRAENK